MSVDDKYVYVMQSKDHVKFGVSKNPWSRIKELQTGNPYKIELLVVLFYDDYFLIEKELHRYFNKNRAYGEWFIIDENITRVVRYMKNIEYNKSKGV